MSWAWDYHLERVHDRNLDGTLKCGADPKGAVPVKDPQAPAVVLLKCPRCFPA